MSTFVIKNQDGAIEYPLATAVIKKRFPNTSFPKDMNGYSNPDLGIYFFRQSPRPESILTHNNVELDPVFDGNEYVQTWGAATPKPQEEIDAAYDRAAKRAKSYAREAIIQKYPDWKQRNMTMRVVTLNGTSPLTDEEQAELVAISAAWDEIDAIRAASDLVEQDLRAMDLEAALTFDIASSDRWPA